MAESTSSKLDLMPGYRRLLLCFDGTWNALESQTNVSRLFRALATAETGCPEQLAFYDEGVGTEPGRRIRGGSMGMGLDDNVLEGYCWLANNFRKGGDDNGDPLEPGQREGDGEQFAWGDLIFLFGFSRGAFTARSVAGMINKLGLIDRKRIRDNGKPLEEGEPVTRRHVREAWRLYQQKPADRHQPARDQEPFATFRKEHCHNVKIACVGVWDTVGALGLPTFGHRVSVLPWRRPAFHDTRLGRVIDYAYHALAIDEHRPDFEPTLWTEAPGATRHAKEVEQRWFPGAHANVGGGYDDDLLCEGPLYWMARNAAKLGVKFRRDREKPPYHSEPPKEFRTDGFEYLSPVRDSYEEMAGGWYAGIGRLLGGRALRRMLVGADGIAQTVDPSARYKWDIDPDYRPRNLAAAGRTDAGTVPPVPEEDYRLTQGIHA